MPNFKLSIRRRVIKVDEFTRVIEADDETDARNIGRELAYESNGNCPDDCAELEDVFDCEDFYVGSVEATEEPVDGDVLEGCECDNTHAAEDTVCRWCWGHGRRRWHDPDVPDDSGPINANEGLNP